MSLASQSRRRSRIRSVGGWISAMASPSGSSSAAASRISISSSIEIAMSTKRSPACRARRLRRAAQILLEDFRREDLARAVGQVVRLVDQQDRFLQVFARQVPQRGGGLEDVVVVGDDRVGARRDLELHLEGADLLAPGLLEHGVRVEVRVAVAQPPEQVRALHLVRVVLARTGRNPRGRGSCRWRTCAPWRGPGPSGTPARSSRRARRRPSSAGASWTSGRRSGARRRGPRPGRGRARPPSCPSRSAPRR